MKIEEVGPVVEDIQWLRCVMIVAGETTRQIPNIGTTASLKQVSSEQPSPV